ncbi:rod shape-determining protein MreC [Virgibacillus necropolis]|uniref:Cell shape-determining protein MreC n=1 Tax=Virgibacillus necropolis TaxID=163877 RepID=A0A221MBV9_9BACI|nr:rod shape-determining protein MreC [Virgibacillus necropolis]ASN05102.1 rod shape-determining protein MreC [Virgibacillus necropolis]
MPFFRKKRLFIILIGIIILVVLIGFSLKGRDQLSTPEQFIKDTVGWAQSVVHTPVKFITDIFTNIDDLKDTYKENQILKEKLSQSKSLIYEVQEIKEANEELRKALDKTESIRDFNPIQATVMSRTPERWVEQVTINKGKQDGVRSNMAVITADGMVGKIQTVSQFSSTVQLLTGFDQFNRISATISREEGNDIFGLIEEYDKETNSLLFKIIEDSETDLKKGELVVSSGMGGVFPAGLTIGTVKEVVPDQYGLTRTALVEPAADMFEINNVIVVDRTLKENDKAESVQEDKE